MKNVKTFEDFTNEPVNEGTNWRNAKLMLNPPKGVKDFDTMLDYLVNEGKLTPQEARVLSYYSREEISKSLGDYQKYQNFR